MGGPFFGSASVPSQDVLSSKIFGFIFVSGVAYKKGVAFNYIAIDMAKDFHKMEGEAIKCRTIPLIHYQSLPC